MDNKIKIIFMGTPEFSVPALEKIHELYGVNCVVTVPDKPHGRGLTLKPSPVKQKAIELGINVLQPESLKISDFIEAVKLIEPDIIVVIAFRILPKEVFTIAKIASFNIHGSLLPKYRGAAPINWAVINGEKTSGLTSFILQEKVDTGNILIKREVRLNDGITAGELHDMLMPVASDLSIETIDMLLKGDFQALPQDDAIATPAPKIFKQDCIINWNKPAHEVRNFIHGLSPYPGAFTIMNGKHFKILKTFITKKHNLTYRSFLIKDGKFLIGTQDYVLELLEVHPENKKTMSVKDYLLGYRGEEVGVMGSVNI
jgi:methionyl-tRNA formyltransferase